MRIVKANLPTMQKVADFGFSRNFVEGQLSETYCGSTAYTAPEVLLAKGAYDAFLSDTWSCGIILYIMLTGTMPFTKNNLYGIIKSKNVQGMSQKFSF
jgi:serine/threonine protein kinase